MEARPERCGLIEMPPLSTPLLLGHSSAVAASWPGASSLTYLPVPPLD